MQLRRSTGTGALIVGAFEGSGLTAAAAEVDKSTGGALKRAQGVTRFAGKRGQVVELLAPSGLKASRVLLVGLGKTADFDHHAAERVGAKSSASS